MALIRLSEYAERHGRDESTLRRKAGAGAFATAVKQGKFWLIDEDEPYPDDNRVLNGMYIGWREKLEANRQARKERK